MLRNRLQVPAGTSSQRISLPIIYVIVVIGQGRWLRIQVVLFNLNQNYMNKKSMKLNSANIITIRKDIDTTSIGELFEQRT